MKYLPLLFLLPTVALAQPPGPQMDPQLFFEETKKMMQPMLQETMPAMQEARACMQDANDQAAFEECAKIMMEMEKKMRSQVGLPGRTPPGQGPRTKDPKEVNWDEATKKKTLKFLDRSIVMGEIMNDCLNSSTSMEQYQQCMGKNQPKP